MNARGIPTAAQQVPVGGGGGYPSQGTPPLGYPPHTPPLGYPPPGYPLLGTPPPRVPPGWGTPPHHQLDRVPPHPDLDRVPPPCGQTHKLKILPPLVLRTRSVIRLTDKIKRSYSIARTHTSRHSRK